MIDISDIEKELAREAESNEVQSRAVVVRADTVKSEPIEWLWHGRVALGKLTLITGDPGLGKSLMTATMAAIVSKGYQWPVDKTTAPVGDVVMLSAEDDAADTTKPRLETAEADCSRIHFLQAVQVKNTDGKETERMFSLEEDIAVLDNLLPSLPECKLLIIDPISAYLGSTNSHKNSEVRALLAPLAALAARHNVAIVAIDHLNKNSHESNVLYRPGGSLAFVGAARAAYIVARDKKAPDRVLVMPIKNNLTKDKTGLAYTVIEAENGQPVIAWELEPVVMTAQEALAPLELDAEPTATDEAVEFLRDILSSGEMKVSDVEKEARLAGINPKPLRLAREKLGIKPRKLAFDGGWVWGFAQDALTSEGAQSDTEGTFDDPGHLGADDG